MMFLLATLLSSSTLTLAHQYQSDQAQFRTWAEAKAMESCWGEENNRKYLVTMKKAVAKCKQQDAPELELPPFRSSYKFVNYLMNSADSMDQYKMEQVFNAMKIFGRNHPVDYNKYSSFNKYEMVKEMMLKHKMMEFMENYMQAGNSYKNIPYSGDFGYTGHKSMFKHVRYYSGFTCFTTTISLFRNGMQMRPLKTLSLETNLWQRSTHIETPCLLKLAT